MNKPFILEYATKKSMQNIFEDLLKQVEDRQSKSTGTTFVGAVLQHLVGAKLSLLVDSEIKHHGASVSDEASGRDSDFQIEDVSIHVTTTPNEALIRKCGRNLDAGMRPIIVTTDSGSHAAEELARQAKIGDRVDVFEAVQFLAGNLYEIGGFGPKGRRDTIEQLIEKYNEIIDTCETDPSLRIKISK